MFDKNNKEIKKIGKLISPIIVLVILLISDIIIFYILNSGDLKLFLGQYNILNLTEDTCINLITSLLALDVGILTIAIPLLGERRIKIEDKYESDILRTILKKDFLINKYWIFVTVHFILGIASFYSINSPYFLTFITLLFLSSLSIILLLREFIQRFAEYEANPLEVSSGYVSKIKNLFYQKQEFFIDYLNLLTEVTISLLKYQGRGKICKQNLDQILELFKSVEDGKCKFDLETRELKELREQNNPNLNLIIRFNSEQYFVNLKPIKNLAIIYHKAQKLENRELARYSVENIVNILNIVCSEENKGGEINFLFRNFYKPITSSANWHNRNQDNFDSNDYLGSLCYRWYFSIVCDKYRDDLKFKIIYADELNKYLFEIVKHLINKDLSDIFKDFISHVIQGSSDLLDDHDNYYNIISKKFKEIISIITSYSIFKNKLNFLDIILNYNNPVDSSIICCNEDIFPNKLDEIISHFFNSIDLIESEFKFRFDDNHGNRKYLDKYLIILMLRLLIKNHKRKTSNSKTKLEVTNQDSEIHENKEENEYCDLPNISSEIMDGYDVNILRTLQHKFEVKDQQNYYSYFIENILKDKNLLQIIGLPVEEIENLVEINKARIALYQLCNSIYKSTKEAENRKIKNTKISDSKKQEFIKILTESYDKTAQLRNIFKYYKLFDSDNKKISKERLEIKEVSPKEAFFDDWPVHYVDWGDAKGRAMAQGETNYLIYKIIENCKIKKIDELEEIIEGIEDKENIIILSKNFHLGLSENNIGNLSFNGKWIISNQDPHDPNLKIHSFAGYVKFKHLNFPSHHVFNSDKIESIIVINLKNFGKLEQYSPAYKEEESTNIYEDNQNQFLIDIQAYSENNTMLNKMLNDNPPEWLLKEGDKNDQKEHLLRKVLVKIGMKFELVLEKDFEGYVFHL